MSGDPGRALDLGQMPLGCPVETEDDRFVRAPVETIFDIARNVEAWPAHLSHYRYVRFQERRPDGGGLVEMSAYRPFQIAKTSRGALRFNWPTWWLSEMSIDAATPSIRFRHVEGVTAGMEVEWSFRPAVAGTHVRILHVWDGPRIPVIGIWAALHLIGPIFVHGIASRTLAGLGGVAERRTETV